MNLSKEVRIGILVAISLIIFFIGFYFLKGANIFSNDKEYYCYYSDVEGLQNSASVVIRGVVTGHVSRMELVDNKGVKVVISMNKSVEVPEGTTASLASLDLLGTKMIKLDLGKGPGMLKGGATLATAVEGGIVDNVSEELTPRLRELKTTIIELDTALAGVNAIVGNDNQRVITATLQSFRTTADNLAKLSGVLSNESAEVSGIVHNANSITGNLAKENDTIQHIMANLSNVTRQLANAPIQNTVANLQKTSDLLQKIMDKINNSQGSLGMLINDKELYNNLNTSVNSIHNLTDDMKAHPSRYINVSVLARKPSPELAIPFSQPDQWFSKKHLF